MDPHLLEEIERLCKLADDKNEDSAFLVFDIDDVIEKVKLWRKQMPRIHPYYAMKCNNEPMLLGILAALDVGFDCASKVEFETIVNLGVPVDRIVYANTFKSPSYLRRAAELKIELMTFDSVDELLKIKQISPSAKLLLRLKIKASNAKYPMNDKFGCDEAEVPDLLEVALQLGLSVVGVSFHVGSQNDDPNDFVMAIKNCRQIFDFAEMKGIAMHMLDIGGGLNGFRSHGDVGKARFMEIAGAITKAIDKYFPPDGPYEIIAEPGRYFSTTAFTLCANIIGKKKRFIDNEEDVMYIINEGIYGLFVHTVFHEFQPKLRKITSNSKPTRSSIWGPSCDPQDTIVEKCMMPDLKVGSWILFEEMGAYTSACATTFNGFEKTGVKYLMSEKAISELEKIAESKLTRVSKAYDQLKENTCKMKQARTSITF